MAEKTPGRSSRSYKPIGGSGTHSRPSPLYSQLQQQQQQQATPSPPLGSNEQSSPQLQIQQPQQQQHVGQQPSASGGEQAEMNSRPMAAAATAAVPPSLHTMSGMRSAQSLAEWQLQAVLYRARLTQYFDVFISQGGDDIDQIMQCDEAEFLEIMSLVGMASKPLHVRRLQRTLSEFSLNRAQFLIGIVPYIGLPPIDFPSTSTMDSLTAALQFLIPGYLPTSSSSAGTGHLDLATSSVGSFLHHHHHQQHQSSQPPAIPNISDFLFQPNGPIGQSGNASATAIALPHLSSNPFLLGLVPSSLAAFPSSNQHPPPIQQQQQQSSKKARLSSFSPPSTPREKENATGGTKAELLMQQQQQEATEQQQQQRQQASSAITISPSLSPLSSPSDALSDTEIGRLAQLANELIAQVPAKLEPRMGQGKRRMERGLQEAICLPVDDPLRVEHFRLFARIYGRFDAKRRPDKALTRHERVVNEAAAQLSLLRPELLCRRDELFPLARKLARMFELPPGSILHGIMGEPGSPERSCSGASSTAESAVETPKERGIEPEAEEEREMVTKGRKKEEEEE